MDVQQISDQIAHKLVEIVTRDGIIPYDTGQLRNSVVTHGVRTMGRIGTSVVGSNLPYARAVHDGRPALTIKPNVKYNPPFGDRKHKDENRARLKFVIGGRVVYAKSVFQKARKARPFFQTAAEIMAREGWRFLMPLVEQDFADNMKLKPYVINLKI